MKTIFYNKSLRAPKVSFVLLDWNCRESFHSLDYLAKQDAVRSDYEIIWIEYYDRIPTALKQRLSTSMVETRSGATVKKTSGATGKNIAPQIDNWIVMEMPNELYYHKHLMYNVGIAEARGEIIVICDSDAMFEPSFVRTVVDFFTANPDTALHIDEIRSHRRDFYPFNSPSFQAVKGEGVINWHHGKTTGLWDTEDPLHTRNYGACLCAWRKDLIAIGGADEHLDYLGHVCGPYELTFRLVNFGRREVWHDTHYIYHTWHPGSDGDFNYIGPSDGRNMSSTALAVRDDGRVMPLKENAAIRLERTGVEPDRNRRLQKLIDPDYLKIWTKEAVATSPNFTLFNPKKGAPKLVGEAGPCNLIGFGQQVWAVPRYLGAVDFSNPVTLRDPRIRSATTAEAATALVEAAENEARRLFGDGAEYEIIEWKGEWLAFPRSIGPINLNDRDALKRAGVMRAATRDALTVLALKSRFGELTTMASEIKRHVEAAQAETVRAEEAVKQADLPAQDQTFGGVIEKLETILAEVRSMDERISRAAAIAERAQFALSDLQLRVGRAEWQIVRIIDNRITRALRRIGVFRMLRGAGLLEPANSETKLRSGPKIHKPESSP